MGEIINKCCINALGVGKMTKRQMWHMTDEVPDEFYADLCTKCTKSFFKW